MWYLIVSCALLMGIWRRFSYKLYDDWHFAHLANILLFLSVFLAQLFRWVNNKTNCKNNNSRRKKCVKWWILAVVSERQKAKGRYFTNCHRDRLPLGLQGIHFAEYTLSVFSVSKILSLIINSNHVPKPLVSLKAKSWVMYLELVVIWYGINMYLLL